ncbi:hypothetical protein V6N12_058338 [Hibiscus sabdariffa]|uniref:Uncharacterized protein n=1 Tax=Hibiscus sabdariffa TaxID=183260 RepID=A0ABR2ESB2_9ROSI
MLVEVDAIILGCLQAGVQGMGVRCGRILHSPNGLIRAIVLGPIITRVLALQRSWGIARSFVEIDTLVYDCIYVQFEYAASLQSSLTVNSLKMGLIGRIG